MAEWHCQTIEPAVGRALLKRVLHLSDTHAEHMLPSEFDRWLEACSFPVVCRPQVEFLKTWAVQGQNTPFPLAELHRFAAPARRSGMFVAAASSRTAAAPPPGAAFVSHPANKPPPLLRSASRSSEEDGEDQLLESEEDAGPTPAPPVTKRGPPRGKRSKKSKKSKGKQRANPPAAEREASMEIVEEIVEEAVEEVVEEEHEGSAPEEGFDEVPVGADQVRPALILWLSAPKPLVFALGLRPLPGERARLRVQAGPLVLRGLPLLPRGMHLRREELSRSSRASCRDGETPPHRHFSPSSQVRRASP